MQLRRESDRTIITLSESLLIGAGGEARVYGLNDDPSLVAKIYHDPTELRARKLAAMIANPPIDPGAIEPRAMDSPATDTLGEQGHTSIIWPVDLLRSIDSRNQIVGFLMPRVSRMIRVMDYYHPRTRRQASPLFNYLYLHRAARNLAAAVRALHARGYVIGDVNESNILVSETALITLVDTDSFQVRDPQTGEIYRCHVGKAEFTPPELQSTVFAQLDRRVEHDLFGLAVIIFQLLMEGTHPYAGIFTGASEPPSYEERISSGHFAYDSSPRALFKPMPGAPPFTIIHPALRHLFIRCFRDGHLKPELRPDAQTWADALKEAESGLVVCPANPQHRYGYYLMECPWCRRTKMLGGRDPFPSTQAVRHGRHLQAPPRRMTTTPRPVKHTVVQPAPVRSYQTYTPIPTPSASASVSWPTRALTGLMSGLGRLGTGLIIVFILQAVRLSSCPSTPTRVNYRGPEVMPPSRTPTLVELAANSFVAFSPVNDFVAVGGVLGSVKIWGAESGRLQLQLKGHESLVTSVAYSPDGKFLASGGPDREIKIWDVETGMLKQTLSGHNKAVGSVAFSPDGKWLASGGYDSSVKLWDYRLGKLLWTSAGHTAQVRAVAFSPDGQILASGSLDGTINLRTPETGALYFSLLSKDDVVLGENRDYITSISFSPDGQNIAACSYDGNFRVWSWQSGSYREPEIAWLPSSVAYSPDGRWIASGNTNGTVQIWSARTLQKRWSYQAHSSAVAAVAFSRNGQLVVSATLNETVKVWRVESGELVQTLLQ